MVRTSSARGTTGSGEIEHGEWADDGPGWEHYPNVKAELNPVQADDGIFWVSKKEFFTYFATVYLCAHDMKHFANNS